LATAPLRTPLILDACVAAPALSSRLSMLGFRDGAAVEAVHSTPGGGRVVAVGGSRIAMNRSVLGTLHVITAHQAEA